MASAKKTKIEFGDFQTPSWFCDQVCALLVESGVTPSSILEPTCGQGNFLLAALDYFPSVNAAFGIDINSEYIDLLEQQLASRGEKDRVEVFRADFFDTDWRQVLSDLPEPLLIIGNPPWVTNAQLSTIKSNNLPKKNNFQNFSGIDAITGASNFDISEWMLLNMFKWAERKQAIVAMLCKTSVARKVLLHTWRRSDYTGSAKTFFIDSKEIFGASVDACLLTYDTSTISSAKSCEVFNSLSDNSLAFKIGYQNRQIIANLDYFESWKHLQNKNRVSNYRWRSGIKHDCADVMELEGIDEGIFVNKLGESYELEDIYLYPMLKSSDIANNNISNRKVRWMIVTQKTVGENTSTIQTEASRTWAYLTKHHSYFERRKSAIYKNRPPYSIFGVGDYTFASWKVAISGLYKQLDFVAVGPVAGKPTVLDDTCYFLPCKSEDEAKLIAKLLNSEIAQQFFSSFIFWDAKRPITAKILNKLNIYSLAQELGYSEQIEKFAFDPHRGEFAKQLLLLEKSAGSDQYKT